MKLTPQQALEKWQQHCLAVQQATVVPIEDDAQKSARIERARHDFKFMVEYYFPHYCEGPVAPFHIEGNRRLKASPTYRAVREWFRGSAKSVTSNIFDPFSLMIQNPRQMNYMVVCGHTYEAAKKLLSDLQAELEFNQRIIADFGKQIEAGDWAEGYFTTKEGIAFAAIGLGQNPRGLRKRQHRPDYMVIDDCDDDQVCLNPSRLEKRVNWITKALLKTMTKRARVVYANNRIAKDTILSRLLAKGNWDHHKVNALDENGKPTWDFYDEAYFEDKRKDGEAAFQTEYMNNPVSEGAKFKAKFLQWKPALQLKEYKQLVAYCDPSYKATGSSDFKAIKLWGLVSTKELHLIKAFVRQCSFTQMVKWWYDLQESFPTDVICHHYMEGGFISELFREEFEREGVLRGFQLRVIADLRKKPEKETRIESLVPHYERGYIFYNRDEQNNPDMTIAVDHLLAWDRGAKTPDDSPDADEGAIYILERDNRVSSRPPVFGRRLKSSKRL